MWHTSRSNSTRALAMESGNGERHALAAAKARATERIDTSYASVNSSYYGASRSIADRCFADAKQAFMACHSSCRFARAEMYMYECTNEGSDRANLFFFRSKSAAAVNQIF